jgi:molybdate transport system substrate-binding protein
VLDGLPADQRKAILANVRSNEPDVAGVVGKVATGAVDAGFVYITDVQAASGELKAIDLPADLKPRVAYGVAVVKGAKHPELARKFVAGLLNGPGRKALDAAGFLPPPGT